MIEKEIKEITVKDVNYVYIKLTETKGAGNIREVELCTRRKDDKTDHLIEKAKELFEGSKLDE